VADNHEHEAAPTEATAGHGEAIHLPGPSYWPLVLSICLVVGVGGYLVHPAITAVGALAALGAIIAWGLEDPNQ
jgi:hypothetical protein